MNRRAFLLGCIATPIATKADAISATLRPAADAITFDLSPGADIITLKDCLYTNSQLINHIFYGDPNEVDALPPLDSPGEPCDASIAGRDQIG